jgi:VCBS repeat-containing protein
MALLTLSAGDTVGLSFGAFNIIGTRAGSETLILSNPISGNLSVTLDPSFNQGGDRIVLAGSASDYTIVRSGSSVVLTNGAITVTIPVGLVGADIVFANGAGTADDDVRVLRFDSALGGVVLAGSTADKTQIVGFAVAPVAGNDAPVVANAIADQSATEDTAVNFTFPANTFSDADLDALTLSAARGDGSALPAWLSFNAATRTFSGTPPLNFNGNIDLRVTASDGSLSASDTFTLTVTPVNDAPVLANAIADQSVAEDTAVNFTVPANAFSDIDSAVLTYSAALGDGSALPAWLSFNPATRTFAGTPPFNFNGSLDLRVTATDPGGLSVSDTFRLTVTPVNDAPVGVGDAFTIDEDTVLTLTVPGVLGNDTDIDLDVLRLVQVSNPGSGTLSVNSDGGLVYTPAANVNGTVSFRYRPNDGTVSGNETTVIITIRPVNDAPVVANVLDDQAVAEDTAVDFTLPANAFFDVDGDTLTLSATLAGGASLPAWLSFNPATRTFSGTPPQGFNGSLDLTVTASDGSLSASDTFTLTVTSVNSAPVVAAPLAERTVAEDTAVNFVLPANAFSDADGDTLTLSATLASGASLPAWLSFDAATRSFSGTPPLNFNGSLDVRVTASDGSLIASDTFTLTVTPVNDAPVVANGIPDQGTPEDEAWTYVVPANAFSDVDNAVLIYSATLLGGSPLPAWLSFDAATRTFTGTPPLNFNGSIDLLVTASDGTLSVSDAIVLNVRPVNDAPVLVNAIADQSVAEDTAWSYVVPANAFSDIDSAVLTYSATLGDGSALPAWLSFDAATQTFSGTPPLNFNGNIDLRVTASDGSLSASDTFRLRVRPVNDAPVVANAIADQSVNEDTAWSFVVPANAFSDIDNAVLTYSARLGDGSALPTWLSFNASTRTFSGTPPLNFNGTLDLRVTASDGLLSVSDTFRLSVNPVNDAPTVTSGATATVDENQTAAYTTTATDPDASTTLTYSLSGADADLFDISAAGVVTFKTAPNFEAPGDAGGNNQYDIIVTASDGTLSDDQAVTITVADVNEAPVISSGATATVDENQTAAYTTTATDPDAGTTLTYSLSGTDADLFDISAAGVVTFKVAPNFEAPSDAGGNNQYDIIVRATDNGNPALFDDQSVTITVADVQEQLIIDLTTLTAAQGVIIQGDVADDFAGWSVSSAGDVNGDGFADLIVGARDGDDGGGSAGEAYVVFGSASGFGVADASGRKVIDLTTLTAAQGFIIQGDAVGDRAGRSVSSAGDVNGDGFVDLIVGAYFGDDGGGSAGEAYVVFGSASGFGSTVGGRQMIDLTTLSVAQGFIIQGDASGDQAGFSVSTAGDVNGDGFADLIVGAIGGDDGGDSAGEAYVVFGSASGFGSAVGGRQVIDLTTLTAAQGFIIQGDVGGDRAGFSVSSAGDINGDGFDDLIVGAALGDDGGSDAGEAYVMFGSASGFGSTVGGRQVIDLTSLTVAQGFIIQGDAESDRAGWSVSSAGDVNGDGFDDLIVGARSGDDGGSDAGGAYVVFGGASGFGSPVTIGSNTRQVIDLTTLSSAQGFIIQGDEAYDRAGVSVSAAGDVNGDGFDDLIVGAYGGNDGGTGAGEAYVVFGSASGFGSAVGGRQVIDLTNLTAAQGFIIQGDAADDRAGVSVSAAGDVNGDGFDDLIVGAYRGDDGGTNAGESYVIFGGATGTEDLASVTRTGTAAVNNFTGNAGNDTFINIAAGDVVRGGAGDDSIAITSLDFADIRGGRGTDTLALAGSRLNLDLTTTPRPRLESIEVINLTGTGNNSLTVSELAIYRITEERSDGEATLIVRGNSGDSVEALGFAANGTAVVDGVTYNRFEKGNANLLVEQGVTVSRAIARIDLTGLTTPQGFIIQGDQDADFAGFSVSGAGDVNGDGFADLIVGAQGGDDGGNFAGEAYVVFGSASGFGTTDGEGRRVIDLTNLSAAQGFIIQGDAAGDDTGRSVSSAGDVNGDGFDDLIVGASLGDDGGSFAGEAYVVFGGANGFGSADASGRQVIDLTNLTAAQGFIIQGDAAYNYAGRSVSSAGDVNGDGFDDLIVGAYNGNDGGDRAGEAYVVFGSASGFGSTVGGRQVIDLTNLTAAQGFIIQGDAVLDRAGRSVSSAGDVNGDGFDDLIVGADGGAGGGSFAGEAYVVFGSASGFGVADASGRQVIDLLSLSAAQGFIIQGDAASDQAGISVSSAGDVNGDGFDDLIVGADRGDDGGTDAGEAYVVFGGASGFGTTVGGRQVIDLTSLTAAQGFIIQGDAERDYAGRSVSRAGDINGDGFDDLIVGAEGGDNGGYNAGEAYVLFGGASGFGSADASGRQVIDLANLTTAQGFIIQGDAANDRAGGSVSRAGDVNSDGFDDLIVGAFGGDDGGDRAGEAYVIFGGATGTEDLAPVTRTGTAAVNNFTGNAGNDTFTNIGAGDVVRGGAGNDSIAVTSLGFADIDGGRGTDTLALAGSGLSLDLTTLPRPRLDSIEVINLTGTGNNSLTVSELAIYRITEERSDGEATLIVRGNSGDSVTALGFAANGTQDVDGITYNRFEKGNANLLVEQGVTVDRAIARIDLTSFSAAQGFIIQGDAALDRAGISVSAAGDVNGDGFADLIVGAFRGDDGGTQAGEAYVVFGSAVGGGQVIDLTSLTAAQGFIIQGDVTYDYAGFSVSAAGDVNGDGFADLIVGAFGGDDGANYAGEAYVIFGGASGFGALDANGRQVIDLASLTAAQGFIIQGDVALDYAGRSVSAAGDVNGDGFDDLIVGTIGGDDGGTNAGEAYVVFGSASGFGSPVTIGGITRQVIDLTTLGAAQGFIIQGDAAFDYAGRSVSSAGDVNGDGFDDLIVGARDGDDGGSAAGEAYVVFGSASGFGTADGAGRQVIDLTSLTAAQGFIIQGDVAGDVAGRSVSSAGDVNGDGFDDLIVGADRGDDGGNDAGEAYVVFGSASGFGTAIGGRQVIDLTNLTAAQGFIIQGDAADDNAGYSVSAAGDINGDGFDDLIVGAWLGDDGGTDAGEAYVVFGSASGFGSTVGGRQVIDLTSLTAAQGFIIQGDVAGDQAGLSVSAAGDVNGDGFDDLIVGAGGGDNGGNGAGEAYVVFGGATGTEDIAPIARTGTAAANNFTGNAGNDTFTNIAAGDVVRGGAGNDSIAITATNFADIDGGRGTDTLALAGTGLNLDLIKNPRPRLDSIEVIDLTGTGNNSVILDELAVIELTEERRGGEATIIINGDAGDVVKTLRFTANGTQVIDGTTYNLYESGNANILVAPSVTVAPQTVITTTSNVSRLEGDSGETTFEFVFTRTGDISQMVFFDTNVAGSGTNPAALSDDIRSSSISAFMPGEATVRIRVGVVGDTVNERDETFTVSLSNFSDPNMVNDPAGRAIATGTIRNDDPVVITTSNVTLTEGDEQVTNFDFVFTRTGDLSQRLSFQVNLMGSGTNPASIGGFGSDVGGFSFSPFLAGEATTRVRVVVFGDTTIEPDETFTVQLVFDPSANVGTNGIATGTIIDDDGVLISTATRNISLAEGNSGTTFFDFVFTRTGPTDQELGFFENSNLFGPTLFEDLGPAITPDRFEVGQSQITVRVPVFGDTLVETDESFTINLDFFSDPSVTNDPAQSVATGVILNDDVPTGVNEAGKLALLPPSGDENAVAVYSTPIEMMMIDSFAIV